MHARIAAVAVLIGCVHTVSFAQSSASDLARMEMATARLEAAQDVRRVQRAFGYYMEKGFWREVVELFTADGTMELGYDGVYVGHERIEEYLRRRGGGDGLVVGQQYVNMQLQGVVTVAPDASTAQGRWHGLTFFGFHNVDCNWSEGPQEITYVRENGVWKIKSFQKFGRFVTSCENGFARITPAADDWSTNQSRRYPHDRPPTMVYKPYPDPFNAPAHYGAPSARQPEPALNPADPVLAAQAVLLRRLQAREEIENLQGMLAYYADGSMWDEAAQLFARDATYEVAQRGVYQGRERIRQALGVLNGGGPATGKLNNSLVLQPVIHIGADGRTARARWRGWFQLVSPGGPARWLDGVYENDYVIEDGLWKISRLHFYQTYEAFYDGGWANAPIPMAGPSTEFPPDRPPTERYGSFPDVYIPPFHYTISGGTDAPDALPKPRNTAQTALARRLERLSDQAQIENLQRQYGYYVDKHIWSALPELFSEDATLEIGGRGVFVGKERIHEYMQFLGAEGVTQGEVYNHTQLMPIVSVAPDGKTARGRWTAFIQVGFHNELARWGYATYENEYVKTAEGWRIKTLYAFFNFYSEYAGWGQSALPNTRPEPDLPPDRPPTVVYDSFPEITMVPFHYRHPVTGEETGPVVVRRRPARPAAPQPPRQ